MLDIADIRHCCADDTIILTRHLQLRLRERDITYDDIVGTIMNGEIIEQYPEDYPSPSCLIFFEDLHVVCGTNGEFLWLVTAYRPDPVRWESDNKTRKGVLSS
ncbi:hypothetical protein FACS18949_03600 [Clostridia bacterium]|nr:hypothetical protein FACS18949_03600 [Clostridia bacterium]